MATTPHTSASTEARVQSRVSRTVLIFLGIALIIGVVVSALIFSNPKLLLLGMLIFVPYAFVLMAPVLLARSTHAADEAKDAPSKADSPSGSA